MPFSFGQLNASLTVIVSASPAARGKNSISGYTAYSNEILLIIPKNPTKPHDATTFINYPVRFQFQPTWTWFFPFCYHQKIVRWRSKTTRDSSVQIETKLTKHKEVEHSNSDGQSDTGTIARNTVIVRGKEVAADNACKPSHSLVIPQNCLKCQEQKRQCTEEGPDIMGSDQDALSTMPVPKNLLEASSVHRTHID